MNVFQWIILPVLGYAILRELLAADPERGPRWLTLAVWGAAAAAIAFPSITQRLANLFGIARGADLVQYSFILAFLAVAFHLNAQTYALQRQVASLVRSQAKHEARFGDDASVERKAA